MQTEMNFGTRSYSCTFRVRKLGAIGWPSDTHTEEVEADNEKAAWGVAIVAINTQGVWEIMSPIRVEV